MRSQSSSHGLRFRILSLLAATLFGRFGPISEKAWLSCPDTCRSRLDFSVSRSSSLSSVSSRRSFMGYTVRLHLLRSASKACSRGLCMAPPRMPRKAFLLPSLCTVRSCFLSEPLSFCWTGRRTSRGWTGVPVGCIILSCESLGGSVKSSCRGDDGLGACFLVLDVEFEFGFEFECEFEFEGWVFAWFSK